MPPGRVTHSIYKEARMVVLGDMQNGYQFFGPFEHKSAAIDWAGRHLAATARYDIVPLNLVPEGD